MSQKPAFLKMKRLKLLMPGVGVFLVLLSIPLVISWRSSWLKIRPFSAPEASYHTWDDILAHPKPITVRTYSTGTMQTSLSRIMNLKHEQAQNIEDEPIEFPVIVGVIQHQDF